MRKESRQVTPGRIADLMNSDGAASDDETTQAIAKSTAAISNVLLRRFGPKVAVEILLESVSASLDQDQRDKLLAWLDTIKD